MEPSITAHVQHIKLHMCCMRDTGVSGYPEAMENDKIKRAKADAIAVISRWRDRVMELKRWNAATWADGTGINPTTITRNMGPTSNSVAKIENLHVLARAAGVHSVLDFLAGDASVSTSTPSAETLGWILDEIAGQMGGQRIPESDIRPAGRALQLCLQLVSENPSRYSTRDAVRAVAHTAVARLLQTTPEE